MNVAPDLVQLQADLTELADDFVRLRAKVALMVQRQRREEYAVAVPGYIQDVSGKVLVRED